MSISYFGGASVVSPPVSAATTTTTTTACAANLYDIPITQPACAMPYGGNHTSIMASCCRSAQVVSYYQNCGLYCLAEGQTVKELTDCLYENGAAWQDVFCNGNDAAMASGTSDTVPTSAQARVVATGTGGTSTNDVGNTAAQSTSAFASTSSKAAAPGEAGMNKISFLLGIFMQLPLWAL